MAVIFIVVGRFLGPCMQHHGLLLLPGLHIQLGKQRQISKADGLHHSHPATGGRRVSRSALHTMGLCSPAGATRQADRHPAAPIHTDQLRHLCCCALLLDYRDSFSAAFSPHLSVYWVLPIFPALSYWDTQRNQGPSPSGVNSSLCGWTRRKGGHMTEAVSPARMLVC